MMNMYTNSAWRRMPSPSVTPNELLELLTAHTAGYYVLPIEPYDEVYPGIFVGDSTTALCLHLLKRLGITHVLNAAWGKQRGLGLVNTTAAYYCSANIEFMGIEALDIAVFPLFQHFYSAAEFIDRALKQNGKILVHCGEGISRSSTLVLAYLMLKRGFRVEDAVRQVVKHRNILPNQGFLLQLCQLHDQLHRPSPSSLSSSITPTRATSGRDSSLSIDEYNSNNSRTPSPNPVSVSRYSSVSRTNYASIPAQTSRRCQSLERSYHPTFNPSLRSGRQYQSTLMSSYLTRTPPTIKSSLR